MTCERESLLAENERDLYDGRRLSADLGRDCELTGVLGMFCSEPKERKGILSRIQGNTAKK